MFSLPVDNWLRLIPWLLIGFAVYFSFGRYHSTLSLLRRSLRSGAPVFALIFHCAALALTRIPSDENGILSDSYLSRSNRPKQVSRRYAEVGS